MWIRDWNPVMEFNCSEDGVSEAELYDLATCPFERKLKHFYPWEAEY